MVYHALQRNELVAVERPAKSNCVFSMIIHDISIIPQTRINLSAKRELLWDRRAPRRAVLFGSFSKAEPV